MSRLGSALGIAISLALMVAVPALAQDETTSDDSAPEWSFESIFDGTNSWGTLTFSFGADAVQVDWTGIQLGTNASQAARAAADGKVGNADGTVDQDEVDDFTMALRMLLENEFGKWANDHEFSGFVLIDQAEAQGATVTSLTTTGMTGAIDSDTLVGASFGVQVDFPNTRDYKDIHVIRVNLGDYYLTTDAADGSASFAGDLTVKLTGKDGWAVDGASVSPDCARSKYSNGVLTFQGEDASCFAGRSGEVLSFAILGEGTPSNNFLPTLQVFGALASIGAAVALRRRL